MSMAGDWIKMRTDLYRDPKVCVMADILLQEDGQLAGYVSQICQRDMTVTRNVMRNVIVGCLVTVWGTIRHRGKRSGDNLIITGVTPSVIDDIADMPGFGDAMAHVGWAIQDDNSLVFPGFFNEYNSEPMADPKTNAERQRAWRERKKQTLSDTVTKSNESNDREEKRREEEIVCVGAGEMPEMKKSGIEFQGLPPELDTKEFRVAWLLWENYQRESGKGVVQPITRTQNFMDLARAGPEKAVEVIRTAIGKGWKTLVFDIKDGCNDSARANRGQGYHTTRRPADHRGGIPMAPGGGRLENLKPRIAID